MLISYPFLPTSQANATDDARLQYMLGRARGDEGIFPVSFGNRWHGGIHLEPEAADEPVRAIADGEIVAYRVAAAPETYPPGEDNFDTSFVLIKHATKSGENTDVVFYSLYMHLRPRGQLTAAQIAQLPAFLRNAHPGSNAIQAPTNTRIWRKDVLGFAGMLYDQRRVHFEIFAADSDFRGEAASGDQPARTGFWRDRSAVAQGQHGTTDVFGDIHFIIPADCTFAARHPNAINPHRIDLPGANAFFELPVGQVGQNAGQALHVVVNLSAGRRTAKTFRILADGSREPLGAVVQQDNYEYELFRLATALYADCPSAGYEYLRFGRILGPDTTTNNQNWQLIRYSDTAIGYIDLAAANNNTSVLSDADFPRDWKLLDEGEAANTDDGICDVQSLLTLIGQPPNTSNNDLTEEAEFSSHASSADIAEKLRFLVCRHPSEWDSQDLAARYARQRLAGGPLHEQADWNQFEAHVNRMAFWAQTGLTDRSVWHFHPLQFINLYRNCLWLSAEEFARCIPRRSRSGTVEWATAIGRARTHSIPYNKYIRKYCGSSRKRLAHNLAQSFIETGMLRTVTEDGSGNGHPYGPFYGRGYHQLTWAGNYRDYGAYRAIPHAQLAYADNRITATSSHPVDGGGTQIRWSPRFDPDLISSDLNHSAESSGYFWVSKSFRGRKNMNRVCDLEFNPSTVGFNCWLINGGGHGYPHRQQFAKFLANVLFDDPTLTGSVRFQHPPLTPPGNPALCATFPPAAVAATSTETVNYEPQIP